ncbi:hypothetical protein BFS35_009440 [Macrococcoides goetzii]|uniref:Uncharacterized protein n=1 Tax=Macrococcoides goetzii TaxID=1891097 RepID=A0A395GAH2_9STAP|nr:hypothetical protein [Macrococcus goetzii]RAI80653.1 hypothetical protein BFS35_009440 [Macrococcus goetzii]
MKKVLVSTLADGLLLCGTGLNEADAATKYNLTSKTVVNKIKHSTLAPNGIKIGKKLISVHLNNFKTTAEIKKFRKVLKTKEYYPAIKKSEWK